MFRIFFIYLHPIKKYKYMEYVVQETVYDETEKTFMRSCVVDISDDVDLLRKKYIPNDYSFDPKENHGVVYSHTDIRYFIFDVEKLKKMYKGDDDFSNFDMVCSDYIRFVYNKVTDGSVTSKYVVAYDFYNDKTKLFDYAIKDYGDNHKSLVDKYSKNRDYSYHDEVNLVQLCPHKCTSIIHNPTAKSTLANGDYQELSNQISDYIANGRSKNIIEALN